jgi:hypothetical protein
VTVLPSPTGDGCQYNVGQCVMSLPMRLGRGTMSLSSHAGDGTTETTWSWRDVAAKVT